MLEIDLGHLVLGMVIIYWLTKSAAKSALRQYHGPKAEPVIQRHLKELLTLKFIDVEEYNRALAHYRQVHGATLDAEKLAVYKQVLEDLDAKGLLVLDNCQSRLYDLESYFGTPSGPQEDIL